MEIKIENSKLEKSVLAHLSLIGSRAKDMNGVSKWGTIIATSPEMVVVRDYISTGTLALGAVLMDVWEGVSYGDNEVIITFADGRMKEGIVDGFIASMVEKFIVFHAINAFLNMYASDMAKKYEADYMNVLQALRKVLLYKDEPAESNKSFEDIGGE